MDFETIALGRNMGLLLSVVLGLLFRMCRSILGLRRSAVPIRLKRKHIINQHVRPIIPNNKKVKDRMKTYFTSKFSRNLNSEIRRILQTEKRCYKKTTLKRADDVEYNYIFRYDDPIGEGYYCKEFKEFQRHKMFYLMIVVKEHKNNLEITTAYPLLNDQTFINCELIDNPLLGLELNIIEI